MKKNNLIDKIKKKYKHFVGSLDKKQRKILYLLEFFILLNLILLPMYALWYYDYNTSNFNLLTAEISSKVLNVFGVGSVVSKDYGGVSIGLEGLPQMFISKSCSGIIPMFLMLALIFALPEATLTKKLKYSLIFLPSIYLLNVFRIVTTVMIGLNFGLNAFDFFHKIFWSYLMIVIVFVFWVYFINKEKLKLTH